MSEEQKHQPLVPEDIEERVNQVLAETPTCKGWRFWCKPIGGGSGRLTDPKGQHHEIGFGEIMDWHGMGPEQLAQSIAAKVRDLRGDP